MSSMMGGTPAGLRFDIYASGAFQDWTGYTTRNIRLSRPGVPGQPARMTISLWKLGGGLSVTDLTEVRLYDTNVPALTPYRRYFNGLVVGQRVTVDGSNVNQWIDLDCVGMDWLWRNPSSMLTVPRAYGALQWLPNHPYPLDSVVVRGQSDGHKYKCTTAGVSGATEPNFNTGTGTTTTDNTVVWTEFGSAYTTDVAVLTDLLPVFFGAGVTLGGLNNLIADVGYIEFLPGELPEDCMKKLAERALSATYAPRANSTSYVRGDLREAAPANGYYYGCIRDGVSAGAQPAMPTTIGTEVEDGTTRWVCMGPTSVAPAWQMAIPADNAAHTAAWTPSVSWYDTNSATMVPTLSVEYSDQTVEDATHIHYTEITNERDGPSYANRVYVFGRNASMAAVNDTGAQSYTGRVVATSYIDDSDTGPGTNAECEAVGNHILGVLAQFEDRVQLVAPEPLDYISMLGLRFGRVTSALLGLSSERYPITQVEVSTPGEGPAVWSYELGAAFRTDREDVLSQRLGGRRFAGDITPPALVTWETNPAAPLYYKVENYVDPSTMLSTVQVRWVSGGEGDIAHYIGQMQVEGENARRWLPTVYHPRQVLTVTGLPRGVDVTFYIAAVDTSGNVRRVGGQTEYSASPTFETAFELPPMPGLYNGDFELVDPHYPTRADGWYDVSGYAAHTLHTADTRRGERSMALVVPVGGSGTAARSNKVVHDNVSEPRFRLWLKAASGTPRITLAFHYYRQGDVTPHQTRYGEYQKTDVDTDWEERVYYPPTGAVSAYVAIAVEIINDASGSTLLVDACEWDLRTPYKVERGDGSGGSAGYSAYLDAVGRWIVPEGIVFGDGTIQTTSATVKRWEPLTNSDTSSPELLFLDGDVVMMEVDW